MIFRWCMHHCLCDIIILDFMDSMSADILFNRLLQQSWTDDVVLTICAVNLPLELFSLKSTGIRYILFYLSVCKMQGDLRLYLKKKGALTAPTAVRLALDIARFVFLFMRLTSPSLNMPCLEDFVSSPSLYCKFLI